MMSPLLMKGWRRFCAVSYQAGDVFHFFQSRCHVAKHRQSLNSLLRGVLMLARSYLLVFKYQYWLKINPKSRLHSSIALTVSHTLQRSSLLEYFTFLIHQNSKTELMISLNPIFFDYYYTSFIKSLTLTLFWGINFQLN